VKERASGRVWAAARHPVGPDRRVAGARRGRSARTLGVMNRRVRALSQEKT